MGPGPFVVTWGKDEAGDDTVSVAAVRLRDRAEVDALIRALVVFRDLLPEAEATPTPARPAAEEAPVPGPGNEQETK